MKRTLLIVAMLMLVTPALAGVTVTATQPIPNGSVTISYSSDVNVRAFALDITVDAGATISRIHDYNTGDTNGYGIFPGTFRDFFNASSPNWVDPCYNPVAPSGDPGAKTGLGTGGITVEMGSLVANLATIRAGTLLKIDVNSGGQADCNLTVALNSIRGGIVGGDSNAVASNLPTTVKVTTLIPCITIPTIVGDNMTDANTALTTAGFTNPPAIAYECNNTVAAGLVTRQDTGCVPASTTIHYWVSTGPCCVNVPNIVGDCSMTDANSQITGAGFVVGTITYQCSASVAAGCIISQNPTYPNCVALGSPVSYVVSLGLIPAAPASISYPTSDTNNGIYVISWASVGGATSYTLQRSTDGGVTFPTTLYSGANTTFTTDEPNLTNNTYRVSASNSSCSSAYTTGPVCAVSYCYGPTDANYSNWIDPNIHRPTCWCYPRQCHGDADGKRSGTVATGYAYVSQADLDVMTVGWQIKDPTKGTGIANLTSNGIPVACANFSRKKSGTAATGYMRVAQADLDKMTVYWNVKEPTKGTGTPADCKPGNRNP
ncbi:MAG: hypothetical protein ABSG82_04385 [Sedimentisphaerales bacterium]|jgi:hypothetical protein